MTKVGVVIRNNNDGSYFFVLQRKYPGKKDSGWAKGIKYLFNDIKKSIIPEISYKIEEIMEDEDINNDFKNTGTDFTDVIIKPFFKLLMKSGIDINVDCEFYGLGGTISFPKGDMEDEDNGNSEKAIKREFNEEIGVELDYVFDKEEIVKSKDKKKIIFYGALKRDQTIKGCVPINKLYQGLIERKILNTKFIERLEPYKEILKEFFESCDKRMAIAKFLKRNYSTIEKDDKLKLKYLINNGTTEEFNSIKNIDNIDSFKEVFTILDTQERKTNDLKANKELEIIKHGFCDIRIIKKHSNYFTNQILENIQRQAVRQNRSNSTSWRRSNSKKTNPTTSGKKTQKNKKQNRNKKNKGKKKTNKNRK